jgi:hypothetical protein
MSPTAAKSPAPSPREIREAARVSIARTAVAANVSEPLVRLYEANCAAVATPHKRRALDEVYAGYASLAAKGAA